VSLVKSTEKSTFVIVYVEVSLDEIKGRIIRNPNYGGPRLSIYGWTWRPEVTTATKPLFREALRDSIAEEGVRNPVVLYSTVEGVFLSFGGSRVDAARAAGLTSIPALVNDYTERFTNGIPVTPDNVESFFTDIPEYIEFTSTGIDTHYSIERNRRHHVDPAGMTWAEDAEWIAKEFPWM